MASNLPDIYTGVAFNAEPFDPAGLPLWVDLSTRYYGTGSASRGRSQYELGQGQTAQADVTWHDNDEALNPANASSPYSPNVVPYRPFLWRVMWPAGGTGNVLGGAGFDGSLESYAVGAGPSWLTALVNLAGVSGTVVTIVGAGAWQGTKAAQLAIATGATYVGGATFTLALIPGRQYTAQVHVNQSSAVNLQLAIANQTITVDRFNRTVAANSGWGTPSTTALEFGSAWTVTPSNTGFSVAGGFAFQSQTVVNTRLTAFTGDRATSHAVQDSDQWVTVSIPVVATGQAIQAILYARWTATTDNLACLISFNTDTTVTITAQKLVAGVTTTIGTNATLPGVYAAGDSFRMHMKVVGPDIWLKAWKVNTPIPEPAPWTTQGSDSAVKTPGLLGVSTILTTGNTNTLPVALSFSDYRATGSVTDTVAGVTATTGAYVLLTTVFTATQPTHQVHVETRAAPGAPNTVLIDGLQVEPGGTANTFTTVGPTIRSPWTRGYVERWPAQWDPDSNGYLGIMSGPVVGPSFQLQGALLHAEYRSSAMAKSPAYHWPLNEATSTATVFGEQSGNGGPSLQRWDAIEGPATTYAAATASNVSGDPSGVGVSVLGQAFGGVGTILHTGYRVGLPIAFGTSGTTWGITLSTWMSSVDPLNALTNNVLTVSNLANGTEFFVNVGDTAIQGSFNMAYNGGFFGTPNLSKFLHDGVPHLVMGTFGVAANSYTMNFYVDGVLSATTTGNATASFGSASVNGILTSISLLGEPTLSPSSVGSMQAGMNGLVTQASLWNRVLSAAEVADLYQAGIGYPNENSGTRVARYVALAGYTGGTDIGQGMTTMGVSTLAENTSALTAIQATQDTEFGVFWESQEGVAFRGRQARYLAVASAYTFGENVAGGEWPYLGTPAYDDDATYVFNNATITRTGGAIVTAADLTGRSQMRYGSRTFTRTVGGNSDLEALDAATYVVANSKDARPRVAAVTFDAGATRGVTASPDGTLWPMLLSLEVGTRITLKRRAKAANGGAGLVMSGDFYIEGITPNSIDEAAGTFLVTLLMSPVPVTAQPWILEDATWGQLDVTTVLGF